MREWSPVKIKRSSSIHISASPATTVSTSSTICQWVGAPTVGATHCSNMQSCLAPLLAETCICVFTPARQSSNAWSLWAMIVIRTYPLAIQSGWPTLHSSLPGGQSFLCDALALPVSLPSLSPSTPATTRVNHGPERRPMADFFNSIGRKQPHRPIIIQWQK